MPAASGARASVADVSYLALAYTAIVLMGGRWPKVISKTTWPDRQLLLATLLFLLAVVGPATAAAALLLAVAAGR